MYIGLTVSLRAFAAWLVNGWRRQHVCSLGTPTSDLARLQIKGVIRRVAEVRLKFREVVVRASRGPNGGVLVCRHSRRAERAIRSKTVADAMWSGHPAGRWLVRRLLLRAAIGDLVVRRTGAILDVLVLLAERDATARVGARAAAACARRSDARLKEGWPLGSAKPRRFIV